MVSILLTVLKIIGITILIILGLILFLLLLILFVPVRYCGKGGYHEGLFAAKLRASWLLHVISMRGEYQNDQKFHIYLRVLGIIVYDNLKENREKTKHKKVKSTKNKTENTSELQAASSEKDTSEDVVPEAVVSEESDHDDFCESLHMDTEKTKADALQNNSTASSTKKLDFIQKIKIFFMKFVDFFKNIKFTFNKVCDTIVRIKDNIKYYLGVLQLESTKRAFSTCQKQLGYVLRKISPRKCRVNLHLGFDDPAVMGEVLAVWGMFYPLHQGNIDIQPEFEQSVVEGDFSFQGRVSVFVFARVACILFFDKNIKRFVKHLKRSEL